MKLFLRSPNLIGDFWGGMAAMLVALPSAIAFGVTIYAVLGSSYAAYGALAGILGAMALGIVASIFGGTNRLITAPCAPAAAVLSAFAIEYLGGGGAVESALIMLALLGLFAGIIQVIFGAVGLGRLIKYMPYPVVSGYLSGVGLYIIASQVPKMLGAPKGMHFWESLSVPFSWKLEGIAVGVVTMLVMVAAPKVTKAIPAVILGLLGGIAAYFGLAFFNDSMLMLSSNPLIIGPIGGGNFMEAMTARFTSIGSFDPSQLLPLLMPALTLAVLLSIDTLKTCVVLDAMTHSRHDSNKELIAQGLGNITSATIGGMPGAGTMGATLVNMSSGACSRYSGFFEGILSLAAFLVLSSLIAWIPIASLSAVLIVIGVRMIDRHSLGFLKSRSTILDFVVIACVVVTALTVSLIAASGVGIILAVLLFIKEQIGGVVVRRKSYGNQTFSKQIRLREEMEVLTEKGDSCAVYELQGSLFFGTTDQLYSAIEADMTTKKYLILDMRRVQSVDITAVHIFELIEDILAEHGGYLIFSRIPHNLPSGKDMKAYFDQVGLVGSESLVKVFDDLDDALEWVEDRILQESSLEHEEQTALNLQEFELFEGRKEDTLSVLEESMQHLSFRAGEKIFSCGDGGDEIYLIRRGAVRIMLPVGGGQSHHISTFGQGNFFGEMSFLDGDTRSADAVADCDTDLFVLKREVFDLFAQEHKKASLKFVEGIASVLADRLRFTNVELRALDS